VRQWKKSYIPVLESVERKVETNLVETDVGGLLTEALTADVHLKRTRISHTIVQFDTEFMHCTQDPGRVSTYAVLADQTSAVGADTAELIAHELALHSSRSHSQYFGFENNPPLALFACLYSSGNRSSFRGVGIHTTRGNPCRTCR